MKRKDVEKALLARGVQRGAITFEELNEALPAEYFPVHELERFLRRLEALGIRIEEQKGGKAAHSKETSAKRR